MRRRTAHRPRLAPIACAVTIAALALIGAAWLVASPGGRGADGGAQAAHAAACAPRPAPPPRSPAYADTAWPSEHADVWRTHAAPTGLPAGVGKARLVTASARLPPEPVWGYVGTDGRIYVVGGSPYLLDMFTELMLGASPDRIPELTLRTLLASTRVTPYVARIDPATMGVDVLELPGGSAVNYTGGLLVHSNGFLYAVARSVLHKIDPESFSIVASAPLPLAPGGPPADALTTYNGIAATADGDLVLKGWASSGGPGRLLRIDPGDLSITAGIVSPAIASARMAIVASGGREYVYFPDTTQTVRFEVAATTFVLDEAWSATYLDPSSGDTLASSDLFMGAGVLFANNTSPQATTPMRVFARGAALGAPLRAAPAFAGDAIGWNFFMMAGDPYRSGIAAVQDQASGRVAGYRACDGGTSAVKLWENDEIASSAGMAVNHLAGHLYTDDRRCSPRGRCRLFLVVLDLRTGRELARVRVRGTRPSMGQIFIGPDAVYYTAAQTGRRHGFVTRVTAAPR